MPDGDCGLYRDRLVKTGLAGLRRGGETDGRSDNKDNQLERFSVRHIRQ
jgi:hypothetical protein